ncbi:hypothetical protein CCHR01_03548 [Colletotrichum chrysophilum]|uniref:Uncharacterized protein n=1 Tax=Colletotrichum chrysophilum TaxID=1836956 RepID=A0AAD9EMB6_9PEZI|nr:hypothetical protein CCHR01_03548 [Colletotrichum chrysophilum]
MHDPFPKLPRGGVTAMMTTWRGERFKSHESLSLGLWRKRLVCHSSRQEPCAMLANASVKSNHSSKQDPFR